jgi:hypothetical protein
MTIKLKNKHTSTTKSTTKKINIFEKKKICEGGQKVVLCIASSLKD